MQTYSSDQYFTKNNLSLFCKKLPKIFGKYAPANIDMIFKKDLISYIFLMDLLELLDFISLMGQILIIEIVYSILLTLDFFHRMLLF